MQLLPMLRRGIRQHAVQCTKGGAPIRGWQWAWRLREQGHGQAPKLRWERLVGLVGLLLLLLGAGRQAAKES